MASAFAITWILLAGLAPGLQGQAPPDLRSLHASGFLLADTNDDGHLDRIRARIVVPRAAGLPELTAAANLAARFAFESYATDLGLLRLEGEPDPEGGAAREGDAPVPLVLVGRVHSLLSAAGIDADAALSDLVAGEGALVRLPPSQTLPGGGVWLAGADATGLLAVADYLAGRYPGVWTPDGPTWEGLAKGIEARLPDSAAVPGIRVLLNRAVVSATRPGVLRLSAQVHLPTTEAFEAARDSLSVEGGGRGALVAGLHRLDLELEGPEGREARLRLAPERPWSEGTLRPWSARDAPDLTLSELFTTRGIYRDTNQDLLPDRIEAYVSAGGGGRLDASQRAAAHGLVDLATRMAHEATGVRLPLVRAAGEEDAPEAHGFPILYGVDHFTTSRLRDEGKLGLETAPGVGFVEFVKGGLDNERSALVVTGEDVEGLGAAARFLAHRLPSLEAHRPGAFGLAEVEEEIRRFFQARSAAGQVALALVKLESWLDRLEAGERPGIPPSDAARTLAVDPESTGGSPGWRPGTPVRSLAVELAVDTVPAGLAAHLEARLQARFPGIPVEVELFPSAFGAGEEIFTFEQAFPWEVEEAWAVLRQDVLPAVEPGTRVHVELRVSEPPEVRAELARAIRDSVTARGADEDQVEVRVLSAYKQAFSWIQDALIPELHERLGPGAGAAIARIEIDYRHLEDAEDVRWQVIGSPTRWLQELFPVEEILARDLGVADTAVVFRGVRDPEHIYRFRALGPGGEVLHEATFDPAYRVIPYFALHPEYEQVRVSTGWLRAELLPRAVPPPSGAALPPSDTAPGSPEAAPRLLADRRIATDLDHFWDFWQGEVQPALRDYVMDLHEGRITPGTAPFFDELRIEARLSEPNHRIGVDEEVISSLESLHNDLYFTSLALFSHLGEHYGVGGLNYPGRILPFIDPTGAGRPGHTRVTLTGRSRAAPELILRVVSGDAEEGSVSGDAGRPSATQGRWRYALSPLPTAAPKLRGAALRAGAGGDPRGASDRIERLLFEVVALDSVHRFDEHRDRTSEAAVDRTFLPVPLLEGMVASVEELHARGIMPDALAFQGINELEFVFSLERAEAFRRTASVPVTARPASARHPVLVAEGFSWEAAREWAEAGGPPMVQWQTPISPPESDSLLARLAAFPEVEAYFVGTSFLGAPLWAADFLPPAQGRFHSRARLTALRPTVFLSGRQHANEVSSTSHLLRLGEHLVTDPAYRALLQRVNVVLNPILNADGAQLAYDMQKVNPDFTLHSGYLGALGVDVTSGGGSDPLYQESRVRPDLMASWVPDAFLNLHGYPSHEWVQHFSGYAAWVRGRTTAQRAWWAPRGWFIPGYSWVDDPDHPEIREAQFHILDALAASITSLPEVEAMNRRQYTRYARYGRQDVEGFREAFHEGMLTYQSLRGRSATGQGPMNPRLLTFSATTEAPDETARGAWLELVASAGLAHTSALLRYMAEGEPRVQRSAEAFEGGVTRSVTRTRPVLPPAAAASDDPPADDPPTDDPPADEPPTDDPSADKPPADDPPADDPPADDPPPPDGGRPTS